jgi:predicted amidohydrolase
MKVAAAQISCAPGDREANLRKVREFSERAKKAGAELIVFPEMTDTGYSMPLIREHAAKWNEGAVPELQKISKDLSIAIVCGVSDRDGESIYNAQVFIDREGNQLAKYRKTHLVTAPQFDERTCFTAGSEFASVNYGEFKFGLGICYDLRFPEMARTLAVTHQSNAFLISSAWPMVRIDHLRVFRLSRAIENQSYVVLANRVGTDDGVTLCGTSAIVDPHGAIVAAASVDREELLVGDISGEVINLVRERMKAFDHRRSDLYDV